LSEAYRLAGKAERLLGEIEIFGAKINIARLQKDRKYLLDIHKTLLNNVKELENLRDTIEFRGGVYALPSPMATIPYRDTYSRWEGKSASEVSHLMRYARIRSVQISAVKAAVDRLRAALAAHRIVINQLIEYCAVSCQRCGKIVRGKAAYRVIEADKCPNCRSPNLMLTANEAGVFRLELIPHAPISGDYMKHIAKLPSFGRAAYARISRELRERSGRSGKSIFVTVRVPVRDRVVRRRLRLSGDVEESERIVRERFGPQARIEFIRYRRIQPALINDRYTRICIALSYVNMVYGAWFIQRKLVTELSKKIAPEKTLLKLPMYILVHDLACYFLLKSQRARRKFVGVFPYLQSSPLFSQIEPILNVLNDEDAALAARALGFTGNTIPPRALQLKLIIEKQYAAKMRGLGLVSSRGLAAAVLYLTSNYSLSQATGFFKAYEPDVVKALEKLTQANIREVLTEEERSKLAIIETPMTQPALEFIQALGEN
jgi:hypothetical protein